MTSNTPIKDLAQEWLRLDQNPETRKEISSLLEANNTSELEARLRHRIEFGTAGLRAAMEAGFSRMNDLTVIQASQGLALYVLEHVKDAKERGVVIGHDHRHHSNDFARLTAGVFLSKGIKVYAYKNLVHTPMVPFGVKTLNASCGIMITASHNPKKDNGYKVYWENACQIIPPHDDGIAQKILENLEPWVWDYKSFENPALIDPTEKLVPAYFSEVDELCISKEDNAASDTKFVYTAMHGVGYPFAKRVFENFGFKPLIPTKEQVQPDPEFPTVVFPNPEEGKGALALAFKAADEAGAKVVFANDPDADRFTVAEKQESGEWVLFTGNQIGTMFACNALDNWRSSGKSDAKVVVLNSTVSSTMLAKFAKVEGIHWEDTLTGFKWIGNRAIDLEKEGYKVIFGYEEAIGFMLGSIVRDKDGVSALGCFAQMTAKLYKDGIKISEYLESLYKKYGYFASANSYFICYEQDTIDRIFNKMRFGATPQADESGRFIHKPTYSTHIGSHKVVNVRDLTLGYDTSKKDGVPTLPVSPSAQMITFYLENGCVFTLRTSGTEPKIKYYLEVSSTSREEAELQAKEIEAAMCNQLLEPEANGLQYRASA
ncbi:Phosphoglucomutase-3 [Entomortierella beljakovae]|nr:Phosphoglucomutase-3 [Entomortierella beljakovae]